MIKDSGKYYLYRHIRIDKNVPFYIGIGTKSYINSYRRYDKKNNFIKSYPNSNIASLELGILRSAIQNNLNNRSKTCNNYIFKYLKN